MTLDLALAYPSTAAQLRTAIGHRLLLATHEGERWACNSYWIAPARRFDGVIKDIEDGCYEPEGKEWRVLEQSSDVITHFLDPASYTVPIEPVEVAGRPAMIATDKAVTRAADERLAVVLSDEAGLDARYVKLLAHLDPLQRPYVDRLSNVRLRQQEGGATKPVGFFADVEVRRGGHRDTTTTEYRWIPETWEPAGERLIGVLRPIRLKAVGR